MDMKRLHEIRDRLTRTSRAPWSVDFSDDDGDSRTDNGAVMRAGGFPDAPETRVAEIFYENANDVLFMMYARTDIPALLDYIEELHQWLGVTERRGGAVRMTDAKSPDGAHLGYTAEQGMHAAMGPAEEPPDTLTEAQMADYLLSAPDNPESYDDGARYAGKLVLQYLRQHPDEVDDETSALFDRAVPQISGTPLEGITGFMVGWAVNAARYALGEPPGDNPAIITIGGDA